MSALWTHETFECLSATVCVLSVFQNIKNIFRSNASHHKSAEKYISIIIHLKYHFQTVKEREKGRKQGSFYDTFHAGKKYSGVCGGASASFLWILKHSENDSCDCKSVI